MKIIPLEELIPETQVERNLDNFSKILKDLRNFGSVILGKIWTEDRGISQYVRLVISCFLRQIIEVLDATAILMRKSSSEPCNLFLRVLFENLVYIKYILENDSEKRAKTYIVCCWIEKKNWEDRVDEKTTLGKEFREKIKNDVLVGNKFTFSHESKADQITKILNKPEYKEILNEFEKRRKEKRRKPEWYSLFNNNVDSIAQLSDSVGYSAFYNINYRIYSYYIHSGKVLDGLHASGSNLGIVQIRNPENAEVITLNSCNFVIELFKIITNKLLTDFSVSLGQWYIENIKPNLDQFNNKLIVVLHDINKTV